MTIKKQNTCAFVIKTCEIKCFNNLNLVSNFPKAYNKQNICVTCWIANHCYCFNFFVIVFYVCLHIQVTIKVVNN